MLGSDWKLKTYVSWVALGCSVLLTALAWNVTSRSVDNRVREQFVVRTDQIGHAIRHRMREYEAALHGVGALFVASDKVTRHDFRAYLEHLDLERLYPGIQGIGYAKLVEQGELDELVARVRSEGFPKFSVTPAGARDVYTPIVYLEPFTGRNLRAFGFDMYADPARRNAMQRAWKTGLPAASDVVTLVQETTRDVQQGVLIYLPVYPRSSEEEGGMREASVPDGFVYSPFRARDLMVGILGGLPTDVDYSVTDRASGELLFDSRESRDGRESPEEDSSVASLERRKDIDVAGRTWRLQFSSRENFASFVSRLEPVGVLAAGITINLLLLYIVASSTSLRRRAHGLAEQMTEELTLSHTREQTQMLASLREKETLLKEIHHRVKNNLQVVSSLLSLQRNHTSDERAVEPLRQSQHRVLAMAALHEFLYQSQDLSRVDTRAYLTHLVSALAEAYQAGEKVELKLLLEDVPLDVDRAIPCGLITNELVSNAFKYAFSTKLHGELAVKLHQSDGQVLLEVHDDGPGLAPSLLEEVPATLGLQLVQLLTEQLGGTLTLIRTGGAHFRVCFPLERRRHGT